MAVEGRRSDPQGCGEKGLKDSSGIAEEEESRG